VLAGLARTGAIRSEGERQTVSQPVG